MSSFAAIPQTVVNKAARIRLAVFDVDGVMTDGRLFLGERGQEYKCFHVRDGQGLVLLRENGCQVAVLSARSSSVVSERMAELGIDCVCQGEADKGQALRSLARRLGQAQDAICYIGDDLLDLPALRWAGLGVAVADAEPALAAAADWVTPRPGGSGAVRDLCELVLFARGAWDGILARHQE